MTSISIKPEDRLEGASNFNVWKTRVLNILEEYDLDSFVTSVVEEPTTNAGRSAFKKNQVKAKRITFDSVKDNIMTVLTPSRLQRSALTLSQISMRQRHQIRREFLRNNFELPRWRKMTQ